MECVSHYCNIELLVSSRFRFSIPPMPGKASKVLIWEDSLNEELFIAEDLKELEDSIKAEFEFAFIDEEAENVFWLANEVIFCWDDCSVFTEFVARLLCAELENICCCDIAPYLTILPLLTAHSAASGGVSARNTSNSAILSGPARLEPGLLLPGDSAQVTLSPLVLELALLGVGLCLSTDAALCRIDSFCELTYPVFTNPKPWPNGSSVRLLTMPLFICSFSENIKKNLFVEQ